LLSSVEGSAAASSCARLNEVMGAFVIDVPVSPFLRTVMWQSSGIGVGRSGGRELSRLAPQDVHALVDYLRSSQRKSISAWSRARSHYQPQRRKPRNGVQCCTFTGTTDTRAGMLQKFKEKPINLEALFTGGNPFDETEPVTHKGDAEVNPDDLPF
jgi:hypothetical protein